MNNLPTRILIVDDQEVLRILLASMLSNEPDFRVVGEAQNGIEAVARFCQLQPDITIMDYRMPQMNGLDAMAEIRKTYPQAKVIIFSAELDRDRLEDCRVAGASAVMKKDARPELLLQVIRSLNSADASCAG